MLSEWGVGLIAYFFQCFGAKVYSLLLYFWSIFYKWSLGLSAYVHCCFLIFCRVCVACFYWQGLSLSFNLSYLVLAIKAWLDHSLVVTCTWLTYIGFVFHPLRYFGRCLRGCHRIVVYFGSLFLAMNGWGKKTTKGFSWRKYFGNTVWDPLSVSFRLFQSLVSGHLCVVLRKIVTSCASSYCHGWLPNT